MMRNGHHADRPARWSPAASAARTVGMAGMLTSRSVLGDPM
jgi:hypothetical protein